MSTLSKLTLGLTRNSKSYILYNGTEQYFKKLRAAYIDIRDNTANEYLYFSFVTLCASTLEYSLNFLLADYCVEKFGHKKYKTYLEEFISLKFKSKLLILPHIVSYGKYSINEEHSAFKKLCELVSLRNKILHNKEFLREFDSGLHFEYKDEKLILPEGSDEVINFSFEIEDNIIDKLDKKLCLDLAEAMGDFKKYLMIPYMEYSLEENQLITLTNRS